MVTGEITIRPMREEDAAAVAELSGQLGYPRSAEDVVRWLGSVGRELCGLVAVLDGEVCGWVEVGIDRWLQEEPYAHIGGLVVRDGLRGKKIGQKLCEAAEQWAREQGVVWMRVLSRADRTDTHRFYLRDGYERVKTSEVFGKRLS
jgi:PhnO protein